MEIQAELSKDVNSPIPSTTDVEELSEQAPGMFNISAGEATEEVSENFENPNIRRNIISSSKFRKKQ